MSGQYAIVVVKVLRVGWLLREPLLTDTTVGWHKCEVWSVDYNEYYTVHLGLFRYSFLLSGGFSAMSIEGTMRYEW